MSIYSLDNSLDNYFFRKLFALSELISLTAHNTPKDFQIQTENLQKSLYINLNQWAELPSRLLE